MTNDIVSFEQLGPVLDLHCLHMQFALGTKFFPINKDYFQKRTKKKKKKKGCPFPLTHFSLETLKSVFFANSPDPNQIPQNTESDQGLDCLRKV